MEGKKESFPIELIFVTLVLLILHAIKNGLAFLYRTDLRDAIGKALGWALEVVAWILTKTLIF